MKSWLLFGAAASVILAILCLLASCSSEKPDKPSGNTASKSATLVFDSFDGGGPEYTVTVQDPSLLVCSSERRYNKPNHDELDGASYKLVYTFRGKKPGETTVTVEARSPIGDNFDETYAAVVDDALRVTLTKIEETSDSSPIEPVPTLVMLVNDRTFYPQPADTAAADTMIETLSQTPLELTLRDNGGFEKTGALPWTLPQDDDTLTARPGDILLYGGDQLCLFYGENTAAYTPLARIDSTDAQTLADLLGDGDAEVSLWVEWSE